MSIRNFLDLALSDCDTRGASTKSRSRDRDLLCLMLFDRPFSPAAAAEKAGKLREPHLDDARLQKLRSQYGARVDIIAEILTGLLPSFRDYVIDRPVSTAKEAIAAGDIPPHPELNIADIKRLQAEAGSNDMELEWITFNPANLYPGKHLRHVRTDGEWYALKDEYFSNGTASLTASMNNSVFYYRDRSDGEGTHLFLTWVHQDGTWSLHAVDHTMVDEEDRDLSYVELHEEPTWEAQP